MRSTTSFARNASGFLFLAGVFTACGPCDDGATDDDAGVLTGSGGSGATQSGGTLTGSDSGGAGQGSPTVTVAQSTGSSCADVTTCEELDVSCGDYPDNCGNTLNCGECDDGEECNDGECVVTTCTPKTCAELGPNTCGVAADGCGGLTEDCGSCSQPEVCGGGEDPSQCAIPEYCTGLCLQQVDCEDPEVTTTITGIITAPGRDGGPAPDPLFDALVYVPNGVVEDFEPNVQCSQCGEDASGDPLVFDRTDAAGRFTLENVPVGDNIPLVIQLGRWRRQVTIDSVAECAETAAPADKTRLPRNKGEGDIPQIAISTGNVDGLECVLRKIGIDDAEFTNPNGDGRVKLYQGVGSNAPGGGNEGAGARIDGTTPGEDVLLDSPAELNQYDMVLFPCQGFSDTNRANATRKQNLIDYTTNGGRIFATHFSYDWLFGNGAFDSVATWDLNNDDNDAGEDGLINQTFPKGEIFAQWLLNVGASTVLGEMPVVVVRNDMSAVNEDVATEWMSSTEFAGEPPLHLTFNTPVGEEPENQCGRGLFSDFHISNDATRNATFPSECDPATDPMTPQEKLVEFMLFDLGSCLTPDIPVCVPKACDELVPPLECGQAPDGCGMILNCGECEDGEICGGGGPGQCGNNSCEPKTCAQQGKECGDISDTCGHIIDCGECDEPGETCGGAGVANQCGEEGGPG